MAVGLRGGLFENTKTVTVSDTPFLLTTSVALDGRGMSLEGYNTLTEVQSLVTTFKGSVRIKTSHQAYNNSGYGYRSYVCFELVRNGTVISSSDEFANATSDFVEVVYDMYNIEVGDKIVFKARSSSTAGAGWIEFYPMQLYGTIS